MSPLEIAKENLGIPELWQMRNWPGKPGRSCPVPHRKDDSPSGSVLPNERLFHDFTSGETFDAPALLARVENLSAPDACRLFIQLADGRPKPIRSDRAQIRCSDRGEIQLPPLESPTSEDLRQLAALRCVSIESCAAATECKHLFFTTWRGLRCWVITDRKRRAAQIRRLDGEGFRRRDGGSIKALTARGSCASWPIGVADVNDKQRIILCEGGGDFLAAYHFGVIENTLAEVAPVAMLGAAQRIASDALARFTGKRVRIFPHLDTAGSVAALRWESQLRGVKINAHCFDLSGLEREDDTAVKDLNDVTQLSADAFEANRELCALTQF